MNFFSLLSSSSGDPGIDEKEYRIIFEKHFDDLRRFLYYKSKNKELSEDVAQDAFVKLWDKRSEVRMETVKTFLFTIGNNLLINVFKKDQHHITFVNQEEDKHDAKNPQKILEQKELKIKLERTIDELPEASRVVFILARIEGKKYAEIAEMLGIGQKAVEKRMSKALKILREKFS